MSLRALHIVLIAGIFILTSCGSSHHSRGPKEYKEKNGLNDARKPHELAAEFKPKIKSEKRAYRKQLRRTAKDIKKRNRKKVKGNYFENK